MCIRDRYDTSGLGLLAGKCTLLSGTGSEGTLKVPHVGWNALNLVGNSQLLRGIKQGSYVYFTHSYVAPVVDVSIATTTYGETFTSAVEYNKIFGVQFHPEKSGDVGLKILINYLSAVRNNS